MACSPRDSRCAPGQSTRHWESLRPQCLGLWEEKHKFLERVTGIDGEQVLLCPPIGTQILPMT